MNHQPPPPHPDDGAVVPYNNSHVGAEESYARQPTNPEVGKQALDILGQLVERNVFSDAFLSGVVLMGRHALSNDDDEHQQ